MEHDLGVTIESELKSADDCILSSVVFLSKCVQEIRLIFEMHYFFFVNDYHPQQQQYQQTRSNNVDNNQLNYSSAAAAVIANDSLYGYQANANIDSRSGNDFDC